jgi:hypothetical protein
MPPGLGSDTLERGWFSDLRVTSGAGVTEAYEGRSGANPFHP